MMNQAIFKSKRILLAALCMSSYTYAHSCGVGPLSETIEALTKSKYAEKAKQLGQDITLFLLQFVPMDPVTGTIAADALNPENAANFAATVKGVARQGQLGVGFGNENAANELTTVMQAIDGK